MDSKKTPDSKALHMPFKFSSPRGTDWTVNMPYDHFSRSADMLERITMLESLVGYMLEILGVDANNLPVDQQMLPRLIKMSLELGKRSREFDSRHGFDVREEKLDEKLHAELKEEATKEFAKLGGNWKPKSWCETEELGEPSTAPAPKNVKKEREENSGGEPSTPKSSRKRSAVCMLPATYSRKKSTNGFVVHNMLTREAKPRSMLRVASKNPNIMIKKENIVHCDSDD